MQQPEPHRNDQRVKGYKDYPERLKPLVWCGGCNQRMQPSLDARFPHEYRCGGDCGGYVDVMPPSWEVNADLCGGRRNGLRCNRRLHPDQIVCADCVMDAGRALLMSPWHGALNPSTPHPLIQMAGQASAIEEANRQAADRRQAEADRDQQRQEERKARRQDTSHHVVYYVRLGHNHVKIGTTGDLPRRMNELRCVNPANLLAAEPGDHTLEKERHTQFRKWRYSVRREDFAEASELLEHIAAVRAEHGDPYSVAAQLVQTQKNQ